MTQPYVDRIFRAERDQSISTLVTEFSEVDERMEWTTIVLPEPRSLKAGIIYVLRRYLRDGELCVDIREADMVKEGGE